jgi:hypothetical protein
VTGDGRIDVVLSGTHGIQILENTSGRALDTGAAFTDIVAATELVDIDQDGDLDLIGQPPRPDDEDFGTKLVVLENAAGHLRGPEPLFDVGESIVGLAVGTDADGELWLAAGTFTHELVPRPPEVRS